MVSEIQLRFNYRLPITASWCIMMHLLVMRLNAFDYKMFVLLMMAPTKHLSMRSSKKKRNAVTDTGIADAAESTNGNDDTVRSDQGWRQIRISICQIHGSSTYIPIHTHLHTRYKVWILLCTSYYVWPSAMQITSSYVGAKILPLSAAVSILPHTGWI